MQPQVASLSKSVVSTCNVEQCGGKPGHKAAEYCLWPESAPARPGTYNAATALCKVSSRAGSKQQAERAIIVAAVAVNVSAGTLVHSGLGEAEGDAAELAQHAITNVCVTWRYCVRWAAFL